MSVSHKLKDKSRSRSRKMASSTINLADLRALGLTPRECEVLQWIRAGKRDSEIARILDLSLRTVGNHAHNIYQKVKTRPAPPSPRDHRYEKTVA